MSDLDTLLSDPRVAVDGRGGYVVTGAADIINVWHGPGCWIAGPAADSPQRPTSHRTDRAAAEEWSQRHATRHESAEAAVGYALGEVEW